VLDHDTATRIAAILSWPGQTVDTAGCLDRIAGAFGPAGASTVVVLPTDWIPLTEQGKPNRPEIRRIGRELAAATG
jgi:fatty-acyl-CoA synthase